MLLAEIGPIPHLLEDGVLELLFVLDRVDVIEPGNELARERLVGEIVVEESGFGVAEIHPRVRGVNKASRVSSQKQL